MIMARTATNKLLQKAKTSKSDEFYTQLFDIERELEQYKNHFKDKVVYCNCDDARISNFFKYFADNFKELGLIKLIASCYQEQKNDLFDTEGNGKGFSLNTQVKMAKRPHQILMILFILKVMVIFVVLKALNY